MPGKEQSSLKIEKTNAPFRLVSKFSPTGDQPTAIAKLYEGLVEGKRHQTLLGATGTGKTFTMANLIEKIQKPTLVLAHNKTLAAQLCTEFQEFFPDNAVSYFVSYYDYYQPEAYMPATDTYIEKESTINEEINRHRHAATFNLLTRNDVIVVSSVSCIYGLGSVEDYENLAIQIKVGDVIKRDDLLRRFVDIQYQRVATDFKQGMFHVMGDTVEIFPSAEESAYRIEFWGDDVESITRVDPFTGEIFESQQNLIVFPAKHTVTQKDRIELAIPLIKADLEKRVNFLHEEGRIVQAERVKTRTEYDIEMLMETGYCNGIENYTRYLSGVPAGAPPSTLIDFFPKGFITFIDESHISIPQVGAMHNGNLSRKLTLIEHGFRLPSANDNRPLKFEEFEEKLTRAVYVSATPGKYEYIKCKDPDDFAQQIIRPTGLLDPIVEVRPSETRFWNKDVHTVAEKDCKNQIDDLCIEVAIRIKKNQRVLVTTATKKMAEKLAGYFEEVGVNAKYLHSEVETFERIETIRLLREGVIDVIVGVNLLREGLDIPEVSFVAILDADKRGFLRSRDALLQNIGRAARNSEGRVVLYGDVITEAMHQAMDETSRRRKVQEAYNTKHGITPKTIIKEIKNLGPLKEGGKDKVKSAKKENVKDWIRDLNGKLDIAVQNMEFEKAADIRDEIDMLKNQAM